MTPLKNTIFCGGNLEVVKPWPSNIISAIVTDAPYELGFMGKGWDSSGIAYNVKMWKQMLRITKPGGFLLCFGGTRTFHRLACAIEDAGWEIRDCMMWLYGCLSEDTEILTKKGWKPLHKTTKYDRIKVYDITDNIYKWETPQQWNVYRVHKDTAYCLKSDTTDQIVSKEHRCLVEREGKLVFKQAWELSKVERVPVLPQDFHSVSKGFRNILFLLLSWKNKCQTFNKIFSKRSRKEASGQRTKRSFEPCLERWSNLFQKEGKLRQIQNKICQMSQRIFSYGSQRWLRYGTSPIDCTVTKQTSLENRGSSSQRPQSRKQFAGQPSTFQNKQSPQITRVEVSMIQYSGLMFCPTVSTGAFVARRNGKVFITGNSGFPKSHNISKAIDKAAGAKRKIIGTKKAGMGSGKTFGMLQTEGFNSDRNLNSGEVDVTAPTTNTAQLWDGYGTALKPAWEPIIVAMKPLDGTFAHNAEAHGVAGLNIDGGRIGTEELKSQQRGSPVFQETSPGLKTGWNREDYNGQYTPSKQGRWPANLLLSCDCQNNYLTGNAFYGIIEETIKETKKCQSRDLCLSANNVEEGEVQSDTTNEAKNLFSVVESVRINTLERILGKLLEDIDTANVGCSEEILMESINTSLSMFISGKEQMEQYQSVMKYIISTVLEQIIDSRISNVLQFQALEVFITKIINGIQREERVGLHNKDCPVKILDGQKERASRFFYQAKCSRKERNMGLEGMKTGVWSDGRKGKADFPKLRDKTERLNTHPTVKPLALMKYLCTLLKMPSADQIILDPFLGSGTTGIACKELGINFIGIEKEREYCEIAVKRIAAIGGTEITLHTENPPAEEEQQISVSDENRQSIINTAVAALKEKRK